MVAGWVIRQAARPAVVDALGRIERAARMEHQQSLRLLALRRYLRLQDRDHVDLHAIWSWTDEQVQDSLREGTGRDLMNEAARVQAAFARCNPGYTLGCRRRGRWLGRFSYGWRAPRHGLPVSGFCERRPASSRTPRMSCLRR
jgi:hypothetical protein